MSSTLSHIKTARIRPSTGQPAHSYRLSGVHRESYGLPRLNELPDPRDPWVLGKECFNIQLDPIASRIGALGGDRFQSRSGNRFCDRSIFHMRKSRGQTSVANPSTPWSISHTSLQIISLKSSLGCIFGADILESLQLHMPICMGGRNVRN